jgi:hypothetical protein
MCLLTKEDKCPYGPRMFHSLPPNVVLIPSRYHDPTYEVNPIVFPFHEVCYKDILLSCFKYEKINTDVIYAICEESREDQLPRLMLDYGNPGPPYEQYWECRKGEEVTRISTQQK